MKVQVTQVNTAQIAAQRRQLDAEAVDIDKAIGAAVETKNYRDLDALEKRVNELAEARKELDRHEENSTIAASGKFAALAAYGGDLGTQPVVVKNGRKLGREVAPLALSEPSLKALYDAAESGQTVRVKGYQPETKAFSTVDGILPPQLQPGVVEQIHEWRLLDYLPTQGITSPSLEYLKHTSSTGTPGIVVEGGLKPDVTLNTQGATVTAVKLAATFGISRESGMDFPAFTGYAHNEMFKQVCDLENAQLISGSGTGGNMAGFLNTSGILTYAFAGGGQTQIDAIEQGIQALRVGPALSVPDLLVMHPGTLGGLRRLKDSSGRYFLQPDLARGEIGSIWGVKVLQTVACPAGTGLLIDTTKVGFAVIREGITVSTGTTNDDFSRNIVRYVIEERVGLAVERAAAVCSVSGLPTS
jgi:HK97 family phage major capsid protein